MAGVLLAQWLQQPAYRARALAPSLWRRHRAMAAWAVSEDSERLGELVRVERQRKGLSLREVAQQSGVSYSTVHRVERGLAPSYDNFVALARWLGLEGRI